VHKLLFDNNISYRVVKKIEAVFASTHVMFENLDEATDEEVWKFARKYRYTIVTKDSDFNDIAILRGVPPKIIWIQTGNCKVESIVELLLQNEATIKEFIDNNIDSLLKLN